MSGRLQKREAIDEVKNRFVSYFVYNSKILIKIDFYPQYAARPL